MIFLGVAALPTTRPVTFTAGVGCPPRPANLAKKRTGQGRGVLSRRVPRPERLKKKNRIRDQPNPG